MQTDCASGRLIKVAIFSPKVLRLEATWGKFIHINREEEKLLMVTRHGTGLCFVIVILIFMSWPETNLG